MSDRIDPTPDNSLKEHGTVEIIDQLSKIVTKDTPEKTQRIVVRVFAVSFPDYHFEFMPNDHHTFKYIRLSWQIGEDKPNYGTYEVTDQTNEDIAKVASQMLLDKAQELDKEGNKGNDSEQNNEDEYPVVRRRRRSTFKA